eukprot:Hpha_TRINITY_DN16017_c0_g2::TRINITY_DN16017_c0_g2_i1::g.118006::m.118006
MRRSSGMRTSQSRLSVSSSRVSKEERTDVTNCCWKKDADVRSCENCRSMFSFMRRRHHCRLCGGIFCNVCSEGRMPLACAPAPQRVCVNCFRKHAEESPLRDLQIQEVEYRRKLIAEWQHLHVSGLFDLATSAHAEAVRQQWRCGHRGRTHIGVQVQGEAHVKEVKSDSAAARAGLREGDKLLRVGERNVSCSADLRRAEDSLRAGDSVSVLVRTIEGEERALDLRIEPSEGISAEEASATCSPQRSPDTAPRSPVAA